MPLSKTRNRERMRKSRLHKRLLPLLESKPVQPKTVVLGGDMFEIHDIELDADGNPIYEEG